jgi:arylsulfatase A-like enzyme
MAGRIHASGSVAALFVLLACAAPSQAPPPAIVVLSLDTLRADHLSSYGYERPTSPRLDAFAADSVRFGAALAQATGTLPSHLSLLTSLNPPQFRVTRDDGRNFAQTSTRLRLPDAVTTLAEVLQSAGYETAAITDGGHLNPRFGFAQGFGRFEVNRERGLRTTLVVLRTLLEERARRSAEGDGATRPPLFLFLHTFDIHEPYQAPEPYARAFSRKSFDEVTHVLGFRPVPRLLDLHKDALTPEDVAEVRGLYDNGIVSTDDQVSRLFELLDRHGLYEDAIVVVLSDHGEEFLEHGAFNHGRTVYEELVRVPLLIRLPGGRHAGRVVEEPVALLDVAPTILDAANLPIPPSFQGDSLLGVIEGSEAADRLRERAVYFESPNARAGVHGLRRDRWKLIRNGSGQEELYDLASDPHERRNLSGEAVGLREELSKRLAAWVAEMEETGQREGWFAVPQAKGISPEERESLRALGYIE